MEIDGGFGNLKSYRRNPLDVTSFFSLHSMNSVCPQSIAFGDTGPFLPTGHHSTRNIMALMLPLTQCGPGTSDSYHVGICTLAISQEFQCTALFQASMVLPDKNQSAQFTMSTPSLPGSALDTFESPISSTPQATFNIIVQVRKQRHGEESRKKSTIDFSLG